MLNFLVLIEFSDLETDNLLASLDENYSNSVNK